MRLRARLSAELSWPTLKRRLIGVGTFLYKKVLDKVVSGGIGFALGFSWDLIFPPGKVELLEASSLGIHCSDEVFRKAKAAAVDIEFRPATLQYTAICGSWQLKASSQRELFLTYVSKHQDPCFVLSRLGSKFIVTPNLSGNTGATSPSQLHEIPRAQGLAPLYTCRCDARMDSILIDQKSFCGLSLP